MFSIKKRQKKLGLSMRGGMARCGSYVGVLKALEEEGIKVHAVVGSSMGAMIGAAFSKGLTIKEIQAISSSLHMQNFLSFESIMDKAIIGDNKAEKLIREFFKDERIEHLPIKLIVQVTDLDNRTSKYFEEGSLVETLAASAAYPFLIRPILINGKYYIDGDITAGFGAEKLRSVGCDRVIGLAVGKYDKLAAHHEHLVERFLEPMAVSSNVIRSLDLELNPIELLIDDLGADVSPFGFNRTSYLFDYGYKKAKDMMPTIKRVVY